MDVFMLTNPKTDFFGVGEKELESSHSYHKKKKENDDLEDRVHQLCEETGNQYQELKFQLNILTSLQNQNTNLQNVQNTIRATVNNL